ncbi:siphovirus Gp157 family protein, partial [Levilactobacillus brevis]|nr:siphovirus Gp157 family protein [Levilactobacillus brevis]MBS1006896.1 siphovirus Gp157 family protein [Levilactobacillus brevis]
EFTEVEKKLNKTAIKQALNDGEEVPGAKLVQTRSIRIK